MYKAPYFTADGTQQGERDLPSWLFDGEVNQAVMHQVVTALRANRRQGTGAAKNRAAVAGGTRKPWRQKGTGRARAGTTRAAQWVGGGRAFPPQPHSWRRDIPRKVKVLARHSAFNVQAADGRVILVERFDDSEPKTGRLVSALEALGAGDKRVLLLTEGGKTNLYLSGRNLARVEVRPFGEESAYDVLLAGSVVIEVGALDSGSPTVIDGGRRSAKKRTAIEKEGESEAIAAEQAAAEARVEVRKARMAERAARKLSRRIRPGQEARVHASPVKPKKATKAKVKDAPAAEERAAVEVATEQVAAVEAKATGDAPLPKVGELAAYLAGLTEVAEVEALRARDKRKTAQAHYDRRVAKLTEGGADD